MDGLVKNNFASVLVFYDQFKRTKLAPSDLVKIAKKYGSKSDQLVHDLEKKYGFPIPKECKASNIAHICQTYSVPDAYLAFLPAEFTNIRTLPYDPIYDIRSPLFDAENVISKKRIISANYTFEMFDNLSKCRQLCNTFDGKVFKIENTVKKTTEGKVKAGAYIHVLERVAVDSSAKCNYIDDNGTESLQMSPFALAYTFMKARSRVRVIIRKRASVRGVVVGFLRAFDKHFNLLLTDVDEEYTSVAPPGEGVSIFNVQNIKRRYLPQLLIRGDNVVLMGRSDSSHSCNFSKIKLKLTAAHDAKIAAASAPSTIIRNAKYVVEKSHGIISESHRESGLSLENGSRQEAYEREEEYKREEAYEISRSRKFVSKNGEFRRADDAITDASSSSDSRRSSGNYPQDNSSSRTYPQDNSSDRYVSNVITDVDGRINRSTADDRQATDKREHSRYPDEDRDREAYRGQYHVDDRERMRDILRIEQALEHDDYSQEPQGKRKKRSADRYRGLNGARAEMESSKGGEDEFGRERGGVSTDNMEWENSRSQYTGESSSWNQSGRSDGREGGGHRGREYEMSEIVDSNRIDSRQSDSRQNDSLYPSERRVERQDERPSVRETPYQDRNRGRLEARRMMQEMRNQDYFPEPYSRERERDGTSERDRYGPPKIDRYGAPEGIRDGRSERHREVQSVREREDPRQKERINSWENERMGARDRDMVDSRDRNRDNQQVRGIEHRRQREIADLRDKGRDRNDPTERDLVDVIDKYGRGPGPNSRKEDLVAEEKHHRHIKREEDLSSNGIKGSKPKRSLGSVFAPHFIEERELDHKKPKEENLRRKQKLLPHDLERDVQVQPSIEEVQKPVQHIYGTNRRYRPEVQNDSHMGNNSVACNDASSRNDAAARDFDYGKMGDVVKSESKLNDESPLSERQVRIAIDTAVFVKYTDAEAVDRQSVEAAIIYIPSGMRETMTFLDIEKLSRPVIYRDLQSSMSLYSLNAVYLENAADCLADLIEAQPESSVLPALLPFISIIWFSLSTSLSNNAGQTQISASSSSVETSKAIANSKSSSSSSSSGSTSNGMDVSSRTDPKIKVEKLAPVIGFDTSRESERERVNRGPEIERGSNISGWSERERGSNISGWSERERGRDFTDSRRESNTGRVLENERGRDVSDSRRGYEEHRQDQYRGESNGGPERDRDSDRGRDSMRGSDSGRALERERGRDFSNTRRGPDTGRALENEKVRYNNNRRSYDHHEVQSREGQDENRRRERGR